MLTWRLLVFKFAVWDKPKPFQKYHVKEGNKMFIALICLPLSKCVPIDHNNVICYKKLSFI